MPEADEQLIVAANIVSAWMNEYKRYLLDGDPNIVHPKARAALVLSIAEAMSNAAKAAAGLALDQLEFLPEKKTRKKKADETDAA